MEYSKNIDWGVKINTDGEISIGAIIDGYMQYRVFTITDLEFFLEKAKDHKMDFDDLVCAYTRGGMSLTDALKKINHG